MRTWAILVVLICVALAVMALPPAAPGVSFGEIREDLTPERQRADELRGQVLATEETLRRRRWLDSLTELTRGAADRPERMVVAAPPVAFDAERLAAEMAALAEDARAELVRLDVARPAVDLGVFVVESSSGLAPTFPPQPHPRVEWYAGEAAGRPYCLTLHVQPRPDWSNARAKTWGEPITGPIGRTTRDAAEGPRSDTDILGPCGFYARHGVPGDAIQRWMETVGASLALDRGPGPIERAEVEESRYLRMRARVTWGDVRIESCLKRAAESCGLLFVEARPDASDHVDRYEPRIHAAGVPLLESDWDVGLSGDVRLATARILDDIEREFGAEAFARFWRSDQPVTVAFADAFGLSTQEWALAWARRLEGANADMAVMPTPAEGSSLAVYALIGLLLAVGVATRRRVG